jgi:hypothetical protein
VNARAPMTTAAAMAVTAMKVTFLPILLRPPISWDFFVFVANFLVLNGYAYS